MISANDQSQTWLRVGVVGKAHGLRGSFFISGRDELIPMSYKTLRVGADPESGQVLTITQSKWQTDRPLLDCKEVTRREEAEALTGQILWVQKQQIPVDTKQEFLWADLPGRAVLTPDGQVVGQVVSIYNVGAADVLELRGSDGRLFDVPLLPLYFVMSDLASDKPLRLVVDLEVLQEFAQEA